MEKKIIIMKKKICAEKLNFGLLPKYIARLGSWPGRVGWPWAVHSVHSAYFRSVLTRFFFFLSH